MAYKLATQLQQQHFADRPWLFPQLIDIVRAWLGDPDRDSPHVDYGDDTFPGLLVFGQKKSAVCEKIVRAIIAGSGGAQRLRDELAATDFLGTATAVSFDTIKDCWTTESEKTKQEIRKLLASGVASAPRVRTGTYGFTGADATPLVDRLHSRHEGSPCSDTGS